MDYNIKIIKKNIKSIYIRVKDDGVIYISAPKSVSMKQINKVVSNREAWIKERFKEIEERKKTLKNGLDNAKIQLFNKQYEIIRRENQKKITLKEESIILPLGLEIDKEYEIIKKFIRKELTKKLNETLIPLAIHKSKEIKIIPAKKWRVQDMKSRYGSYSKKTDTICLNLKLAAFSDEVILSVIYHELAHTKVMNHQDKFYEVLFKLDPDYKKHRKILNSYRSINNYWFLVSWKGYQA